MASPSKLTRADLALLQVPGQWQFVTAHAVLPSDRRGICPKATAWRVAHQHAHAHMEVLLALSGTAHYGMGRDVCEVGPGTLVLFEPGDVHDQGYPPGSGPFRHLWLAILDDHAFASVCAAEASRDAAGYQQASIAVLPYGPLKPPRRSDCHVPASWPLRVYAFVAELLARLLEQLTASEVVPVPAPRQVIPILQEHIVRHLGSGLSVDTLARISGYSRSHLSRMFKAQTGLAVHEFVDRVRLERAQAAVAQGRRRKEIAYELGFSGLPAFSRWYGKAKGHRR